ncbi:glycosyltransferase family 4 protein [Promineifilum sp.]|uniref:glycosyltransferase family 4 protein n=1 Tax=Promineifilum sp. TaxID=2664178 RepID=UPI0035B29F42
MHSLAPWERVGARVRERPLRLCFVGPMLGVNPGWVTTQGEILAALLAGEGYPVRVTSHIPARLPRLADTLRSLVAWRGEIDLVVHQVYGGMAFAVTDAASLLCRALGLRQVFVLHGGTLPEMAARQPRRIRRVVGRAAAVVAPSAYMAHVFGQLPELAPRLRIIPNVLAIENYPYHHRPTVAPRLLWMRTFHDVYHPEMALEVLADLRRTHPAAMLTMAGQEKGLHAAVVARAAALGLAEAVRFPGFLGPQDKVREFTAHDIYLNTNRVDNMPVSVLEAAAFGLPVVATAVGGVPYLLRDGETGLLVPADGAGNGDVAAMSDAIRRLLNEPGLAGALSANGRRLAESCAWESVRTQWETLFRSLVETRFLRRNRVSGGIS